MNIVGVDIGGTFTDLVGCVDGRIVTSKTSTVPADPTRGVADSLALAQALWCRGIAADVFFGVRLNPFAAHAWVQQDNLLLSDPLNIVADYRPVFRL